jgi:hypothetical protein
MGDGASRVTKGITNTAMVSKVVFATIISQVIVVIM